jgi:hypothetical protein
MAGRQTVSTELKEARAEAKGAKAHAKALRPWYRKKRYWALAILALVIGVAVASGGGSKSSNTPSSGVSSGLGASDATADVTSIQVGAPDALGLRSVTLVVTNHSSERSDYAIELSIESPDGKTQYDTSFATVLNLEAGQTSAPTAFPITKQVPDDAVAKLKTVQRTAAL